MSSLDNIYKKMAASLDHNQSATIGVRGASSPQNVDLSRHISPSVAHELNNILTVIQGYADRMLIKHSEDYPDLQPNFKVISDAARRAADVIRQATPPLNSNHIRQVAPKITVQAEPIAA